MKSNEDKILMAEYRGYFPQDIVSEDGNEGWWSLGHGTTFPNHNFHQIIFAGMKFHTSWDWLMPVYNKLMQIDDISFATTIDGLIYSHADCFEIVTEALTNGSIDKFFDAIVIFIKWVNAEKKDRE